MKTQTLKICKGNLKFVILAVILTSFKAQAQTSVCFCVTTGFCTATPGSNDGSNQVDPRRIVNSTPAPTTTTVTPVSSGLTLNISRQSSCRSGLSVCCLPAYQCGISYPPVANARPPAAGTNQATFGEYPWQALILLSSDSTFVGSGALIDNFHVLTVAHKVNNYVNSPQTIKVRLGEWDASSTTEPIPAQEFAVTRIFIHPAFNSVRLRNSIAIVRLQTSVPLGQTPTITTVCLPSGLISNQRCFVAGWGLTSFVAGVYQTIQREVDVPLVDQNTCQNQLRATRLGSNFQLDFSSFICAGGEVGKDACTGDGGSPLICKVGNNWYAAGLVAWGIGCATANVPGVYMNVANYISWIQQTTRTV